MVATLLLMLVAAQEQVSVEKIHLKNAQAEAVYDRIKEVSIEGLSRVVYDPTDNSILAQGTRSALDALRKLVAQIDDGPLVETLPLIHTAASYIHGIITLKDSNGRSMLPTDATAKVDKESNAIVVTGTSGAIRETEQLLRQFDVKPRELNLSFRARLPHLGRTIESTGTVQSNATWRYEDRSAALSVTIHPMFMANGDVMLVFKGGPLEANVVLQQALRPRERVLVCMAPRLQFKPGTNEYEPVVLTKVTESEDEAKAFLDGTFQPANGWSRLAGAGDLTTALQSEMRMVLTASLP